jgi:outer membrane protein assembly factor BamB
MAEPHDDALPALPGEGTTGPPAQLTPPKRDTRKKAGGGTGSRPRKTKQSVEAGSVTGADISPAKPQKAPRTRATKTTAAAETAGIAAPGAAGEAGIAAEGEAQQAASPKKVTRARKAAGSKPRTTRSRKKPAPAVEQGKQGEQALAAPPGALEAERVFEPELDTTPVRPRHTATEERRAALFSDLETGPPLAQAEIEPAPSEIEETVKRPALETLAAPTTTSSNGHLVGVAERPDFPEVPETPLPGFDVAAYPDLAEVLYTPLPAIESAEMLEASVAIPETPRPPAIEEQHIPITPPLPLLEEEQPAAEVALPPRPEAPEPARPSPRPRPSKGIVAIALLFLVVLSTAALWRDASDAHLYLYSIDAQGGQVQAQQDLGSGYANTTLLTNAVLLQSSLLVGLPGSQRVLSLSGGNAGGSAWSVARQINAPLSHATLSVTPTHALVVASASGVQVLNPDGSLLWQTRVQAPSQGAHAFAPAFDATTLYAVINARKGAIAAFDQRSGTMRWSQQLDDSFNAAPPFLLYGNTLFVAGDHTIYALDRAGGSLLWKAAAPARTLLIEQAGRPVLIAAGATGLRAFDAQSGAPAWTFDGHPGGAAAVRAYLTDAQFYQASLSATNDVVYATGIVWDEQQAREQLWLYAVDASTGALRWSEPVGTDFASADAGRVLAPYADAAQGLVLLEIAQGDGSHTLAAYNSADGSLRWRTRLAGVTAFAPGLIQAASGSISVFSVQADAGTALRSWSWLRLLLLALGGASLLLLLGVWLFPLESWSVRTLAGLKAPPRWLGTFARQIRHRWRGSRRARLLVTCGFIAIIAGTGVLTYVSLSRPQQFLNAVEASTGSTQWQRALDTPATLSGTDGQESFVVMKTGSALSVLSALNSDGSVRWSTPASEGAYTLPAAQTAPGTLLVALSGPSSTPYRYAPEDPAYPQLMAHLFALALLDSATGRMLWQHTLVRGDDAQESIVLGTDAHYTYVASRSIHPTGQGARAAVVQLIAVDTASGAIAWRVFGPREDGALPPDFGALLPQGRLLYWQVASTVYGLDTQLGQIQWRRPVAEVNATSALLEEPQMALSGGVLLVRRSDHYHALDAATGNLLWSANGLGSATPQSPGGALAAPGEFILYGNGTIEALDASTQAVLWSHDNLATISEATLAPDGSLVYAIVLDSQDGATPQQALVAFDTKDSAIRWTFQPSGQVLFIYPGAPQLRSAHGMLYVALCLSPGAARCHAQALYGINGTTGAVSWKFGASQVSAVQVTQDGGAVVFQTSSSLWENLKARLQGG